MKSIHFFCLALFFICTTPLVSSALVQQAAVSKADLEKAKALFDKAEAYYNVGDYELALQNYKEAYFLSKKSALIYNIAQCNRQLGKNEEAIRIFRNFLKEEPSTPLKPKVEELIAELEALVAKSKEPTNQPETIVKQPDITVKQPETAVRQPETTVQPNVVLAPELKDPSNTVVVTPVVPGPVDAPKRSRKGLYLGIGSGVLGVLLIGAIAAGNNEPSTDLGTFRPFE